jgi:hypothetical protein
MPNKNRKRSDYRLELDAKQFEAFSKIAKTKGQSVEEAVLEALDRFIETEKQICQLPKS